MLITTCAHCQARFRVTPQQLNARQGQVRCGRCLQVFNGFQVLERFPDDDTGGRLLAEHDAGRGGEGARADPPAEPAVTAGAVDLPLFDEETPRPPPEPPTTAPASAIGEPEAPATDATHTRPRRAEREAPGPPAPAPQPEFSLEVEPPEPPARAWRFAAALLALTLVLEIAYAYRGPIAQRYPVLRPAMESVCARTGCTVPYAREETALKLEDSELLEVPGKPGEIALGARIRNLAMVAQEYPHLELTLTDLTGQAAVRRVLRPTDYLGRPLDHGEVIGPGVEVALQLRLETPRVKPTGYQLLVFYP